MISYPVDMASITIRNLEDDIKARLRVQAAQRGRSMEEEARDILRVALCEQPRQPQNLAAVIRRRFADAVGVERPDIDRDPPHEPPRFER